MCNKDWFDKLSAEHRAIVTNGWNAREQARDARVGNDKFIAEAASKGVTVYKPGAAEMALWQAAGRRASEEILSSLGADAKKIYDEIQKDLASVR